MASPSAIQVISPAIERTKRYLFMPFRLGRFLKLTLVALLTEGGISSCNFNSRLPSGNNGSKGQPFHLPHIPSIHWPAWPVILGITATVMLAVLLLGIVISYLLIRLRFAYFDCVLYEQDQIAPAWARYHRQALRYLGLSLCIAVASWVILIPIGYEIYQRYKPLIQSIGSDHPAGWMDFLPLVGVVMGVLMVVGLFGYLLDVVLKSFVLPRMALEDATVGESLEEVWNDIQAEPGAFALFVLFRALLGIAATVVAMIGVFIAVLVLALLGLVIGLILKAISQTLLVVVGVPAAILVVLLGIPVLIGVSGVIGTFRRNYAILFYAGRYPEMASIVWPPLPPPGMRVPPAPVPPWDGGHRGPEAMGA